MKRAIIVHCWEGYPEYCWYPYVKQELEKNGFQVEVPAMPDTATPKLDKWLPKLQSVIGNPDEELQLIGHSLGCVTIMRYLESLPDDQKIGRVVFVAGFNENVGFEEIQSFFETPIDMEKVKSSVRNGFVAITSDDDPYVPMKYAEIFREKLGADVILKPGAKHFSGSIEGEEACLKLSELVDSVLKLSKK